MVSTDNLESNLAQAADLVREAAGQGARFALLPEYFPIMSDDETAKISIGEVQGQGPIQDFLAGQAAANRIWLMAGTFSLQSEHADRVYNTCLLFSPDGLCTHRYDKVHLFDVQVGDEEKEVYNESDTIVPGSNIVVAKTPLGNIGMTVCYDLRFPELYRRTVQTTGGNHYNPVCVHLRHRKTPLGIIFARPGGGKSVLRHRLQPGRAEYGNKAHLGPQYDYRPLGRCLMQPGRRTGCCLCRY